jgi:hypothetical protein
MMYSEYRITGFKKRLQEAASLIRYAAEAHAKLNTTRR